MNKNRQNTPAAIPVDASPLAVDKTQLTVPELPGTWEWRTAYRTSMTNKVTVFFGYHADALGGWLGEIDNYPCGNTTKWDIHVRKIVDNGGGTTRPAVNAETVVTINTLAGAIEHVPEHIKTHYSTQ